MNVRVQRFVQNRYGNDTFISLACDSARMLFKKKEMPAEVKKVGLDKWYSKLSDESAIKLKRYVSSASTASHFDFFISIIRAALEDDNYTFTIEMCVEAYKFDMTDIQRFIVNEEMIDGYVGAKLYDDAIETCKVNMELYPKISSDFIRMNNGKIPDKINFRNKMIDVLVGIECNYDLANEMLSRYFEMGLISEEDLGYRKQSLKIHRLQKTFDGLYTYRPIGEDSD